MANDDQSEEAGTAGWDAITAALRRIYGDVDPFHVGTLVKWMLGGPDPLDGISVYANDAAPTPRWHYVSYGMSELYEKESEDAEISGWGFEFTFRLARRPGESEPPKWPFSLLQNLGRYVFQTGNVFAAGHHVDLNGPIALEEETEIRAVLFAADPQLDQVDTPHGKVAFLQIVGITLDELEAVQGWNGTGFLDVLKSAGNPLLVTDLARQSVLNGAAVRRRIEEGTRADGSSTGAMFGGDAVDWTVLVPPAKSVKVTVGATAVGQLKQMLTGRIPHGRGLALVGRERRVIFEPGDAFACELTDDGPVFTMSPDAANRWAQTLQAKKGVYRSAATPGLTIEVVPSVIKDQEGNVVRVVGE